MNRSYEFTGKTTEEAISAGLEQLGVTISDVTFEIIQEGSKGLFGLFGSRAAKIKMTLNDGVESQVSAGESKTDEQPKKDTSETPEEKPVLKQEPVQDDQRAAKAPAEAREEKPSRQPKNKAEKNPGAAKNKSSDEKPAKKAKPRTDTPAQPVEIVPAEQADRATAAGQAQDYLQKLTELMGVHVAVHVSTDEEGNVKVNMEGDTLGVLIGRRGETLDALQYLTSLQINKGKEQYTRVTLDTENYREKREEALIRLANRMANKACKTGRKVSMEPMNPYERRILHSALQNNPNVETHSEGDEPNRHVVITVNKQAKQAERNN